MTTQEYFDRLASFLGKIETKAMIWADEKHDGMWSKAQDKVDLIVSEALKTNDHSKVKEAMQEYYKSTLMMAKMYAESHKEIATKNYLSSIKERVNSKMAKLRDPSNQEELKFEDK